MALSRKQQRAVKQIAVAYGAFSEAVMAMQATGGDTKANANTVLVWGRLLDENQKYLGAYAYDTWLIEHHVNTARAIEARPSND